MAGSGKLLFPRPATPALDAVFLNTAGGLTGGDRFALTSEVKAGAALRLTTQAAERAYRARDDDPPAVMRQTHTVGPGATLFAVPQETILFDGAALDRHTVYDLAVDARLVACEALIFGRAAMGEAVGAVRLADRIDVQRDGALVFTDRLRLTGDAQAQLSLPAVAGGARAVATVLMVAPGAWETLETLRVAHPPVDGHSIGLSAPLADLVVARILARDGFALRAALASLLHSLCNGPLPRPWTM